ncbi:hypothetical protein B0T17DRAFT_528890 [Bombardia bombarda]|uniref:Uncharacterized protein n=1 Tax=Bombardia bombarda TaxID=252184 RepID=A0AA40CA13_9PEZI|nr:hypothetical protein B0T17DRAFT_528890 [Bombardia bombarda]
MTSHLSESTTVRHSPDSFLGLRAAMMENRRTADAARVNEAQLTGPLRQADQQQQMTIPESNEGPATAISFPSRRKSIRVSIPPMIPRRLTSSLTETSSRIRQQQPVNPSKTLPRIPSAQMLSLELENQNPADRWASTLMQDLDGLERSIESNSREMKAWTGSLVQNMNGLDKALRSACTPITITTGCAPSPAHIQVSHGCDEKVDVSSSSRGPMTVVSNLIERQTTTTASVSHPASPLSSSSMLSNACLDLLGSPPKTRPNVWPSMVDGPLETATRSALTESGSSMEEEMAVVRLSSSPSRTTTWPAPTPTPRGSDTTSASLETSSSTEEDCKRSSSLHESGAVTTGGNQDRLMWEMRKTMRPSKEQQRQQGDGGTRGPATAAASASAASSSSMSSTPTCTYTCRARLPSSEPPRHAGGRERVGDGNWCSLEQAMAQGAARTAFVQHQHKAETGAGAGERRNGGAAAVAMRSAKTADEGGFGGEITLGLDGGSGPGQEMVPLLFPGVGRRLRIGEPGLAGTAAARRALMKMLATVATGRTAARAVDDDDEEDASKEDSEQGIEVGHRRPLLTKGQQPPPLLEEVAVRLRTALSILRAFIYAYWGLVRPVFDSASPLRTRYAQHRPTWADCFIWLMAGVFVFLVGAVGLWLARAVIWVVRVLGAVAGL